MTASALVDLSLERARRGLSTAPWVSKKECARHFNISIRTLYRWTNDTAYTRGGRQCPSRKLWGGPVTFQLDAVEAWLGEPMDRS